ncbi:MULTISPECIES: twin-arginine translocase TatA/TatE family subunit [unclassified Siphonobacter]|uniref:Sec-independent protein translocase subunit TatA/TatB n=1 Tax=unclassified Siphonobacter TaxID=2635712 RepID=UPI000CC449C6|nr:MULTISPECIES: twin-arginine translocase TatA/TatE family subunit [unclassified Siphonobacter]MDQ1087929.1 sec-independent protein translocase protein TatA [Siphonobacter sp. SORGH_AS_1065]MDR6194075.1 sec-independent protein translocase protein TatA [Siphonobacter sp. SORGH_AS_0500]PKK36887.1 twin-arginine translocase TatA/TatE family subunit [Siphonobacter sp. SORGH_AS_0500]
MFGMGGPEVALIAVAFVLLFGAKKIPELARGLGKGIREFKDASREIRENIENPGKE